MTVLPDYYIREASGHSFGIGQFRPFDHNEPKPLTAPPRLPLISPFSEDQLQPASYDVKLGDEFIVFEPHDERVIDLDDPKITTKKVIPGARGFVLHPGEFCLGVTEEVVCIPDNIVSRIEGKSSIGRLGLAVHVTAGFIDPGFHDKVTLEMVNLNRVAIVLRPGKLVAQLSFQYTDAPVQQPYEGRYQGDMGVAESRYGKEKEPVSYLHPRIAELYDMERRPPDDIQERVVETRRIPSDQWMHLNSADKNIRELAEAEFWSTYKVMVNNVWEIAKQGGRAINGTEASLDLDHMTVNRFLTVWGV